ncbi:MAG: hypothetical protein IH948_04500, partial [Bacteroidetes bacterium]|nr:hypothetical protein [Bacteroidota bacterium]
MKTIYSLILLLVTSITYGQQGTIIGECHNNQVKLLWILNEMPDNLEGFWVKSRSQDKKGDWGEWEQEHKELIVPELSRKKLFNDYVQDEIVLAELVQYQKDLFDGNIERLKLNQVTPSALVENLNDLGNRSILIALLYNDYYTILNVGFGFVDNKEPRDFPKQYGVFIQTGGVIAITTNLIYEVKRDQEDYPDLNSYPIKKSISDKGDYEIYWEISELVLPANNIKSAHVYKKVIGEEAYELIKGKVSISNQTDSMYYHRFRDKEESVDKEKEYLYTMLPVSTFRTEWGSKEYFEIQLRPKYIFLSLPNPKFITNGWIETERIDSQTIESKLEWTYNKYAQEDIDQFYIWIKVYQGKDVESPYVLVDSVPRTKRIYTHIYKGDNTNGHSAKYKLTANRVSEKQL